MPKTPFTSGGIWMFRAGIRAECMEDVPIHFTGIHMYGIHVDRYIF